MLIGVESGNELFKYKLKKNVLFLFLFCVQTNKIDGKAITRVPAMPGAGTNKEPFTIDVKGG